MKLKRKKRPCVCKHGYLTHGLDGMCGAEWCSCRGYREQPTPRPKKARREP
jgi:hypothetical protein